MPGRLLAGAVWIGLSLTLQDDFRARLGDAIGAANAVAARTEINGLVGQGGTEAVDALLWGLGKVEQEKISRERKRDPVERKVRAAQEKYDGTLKEYSEAFRDYLRDRTNASKRERYEKASEARREAARELGAARGELNRIDQDVRNLSTIGSLIRNALGKLKDAAAVERMLGRLTSEREWAIRAGIARALGGIDRPGVLEALIRALRSEREDTVKVALIEAIAAKGKNTEEVRAALTGQLKGKGSWQVVFAALQGLKSLQAREAIPEIIEAMAKAEGRLRYDFRNTLIALTGVDKGIMADAWRAWFEQNREAVLSGTYKPRPEELPEGRGGATTFFGIPVESDRVVFVLDRSGSMRMPADWVPEIGTGERLPEDLRRPRGTRKIDVARWQLKKVLFLMPEGARFNIIFYNGTFTVYKSRLVKLNRKSRKDAYRFIDKLEPEGATNIFDSLERAIRFAVGKDGKIDPHGPDTIYLLSDGLPNRGKFTRPDDIRREIRKLNENLKLRINTIWVGSKQGGPRIPGIQRGSAGEDFMEALAKENNGRFVSSTRQRKAK